MVTCAQSGQAQSRWKVTIPRSFALPQLPLAQVGLNGCKKLNKTESLLLCPPQLSTENQEPNGQGVSTKATRNPTKLMLIAGSIMNREVLRANLAS